MSNKVYIQLCMFTDFYDRGTYDESYGYRIWDDYEQHYDSTFDSIEEVQDLINEENLLKFIYERYYDFWDTIEDRGGLYLNQDWVELKCELFDFESVPDSGNWDCQD
jgi:hypothetical protein